MERLAYRVLTERQVMQIMLEHPPFDYVHRGVAKVGFYDPARRVLVSVIGESILTVIDEVVPGYIAKLKRGDLA